MTPHCDPADGDVRCTRWGCHREGVIWRHMRGYSTEIAPSLWCLEHFQAAVTHAHGRMEEGRIAFSSKPTPPWEAQP